MRKDRTLGEREDFGRIASVDRGDDLIDGARALTELLEHLPLSVFAMRNVLVQLGSRVHRDRAVPWVDDPRVQLLHPAERSQVLHQVPIGRVDEARPTTDHGVAGEQRTLRRNEE